MSVLRTLNTAALILLSASLSFSREKQEHKVFINVGVGPAVHFFPGPLMDVQPVLPGLALELYGVAPKETIQANASRIKNRKARNFAKGLEEVKVAPLWLGLIPDRVILAPGDSLQAFGATWTLFGAGLNLISNDVMRLGINGRLPTLTYSYFSGPALEKPKHYFGFGLSPGANLVLMPRKLISIDLGYRHNLYLQTEMNNLNLVDAGQARAFQHGTAHLLFHLRIPTTVKM